MTYSYYIRTQKGDLIDLTSMTKEEQQQIGQILFRTMLESIGYGQEKKKEKNKENKNENNNSQKKE